MTLGNDFICGNKSEKGILIIFKNITDISINYLLNIIDYFKIEKIIVTLGPLEPYYNCINGL